MKRIIPAIAILLFLLWSCEESTSSNDPNSSGSSGWLIPESEVVDGGPGKDGIPALTNPELLPVNSISYLENNDLVIAVKYDNEIRVYPHKILDWHEIINDGINQRKFAITYCPLTGSGISYNRTINGNTTTFGVSGLLYNTNLIPYDRATNSNWSQMKLMSVNGELIGQKVETLPMIETTWKNIKQNYEDAKVVSTNTGHSRNYNRFPYGDYKTNHNFLLFPVSHEDDRLPRKERVLGVLNNGAAKAFTFSSHQLSLVTSNIAGLDIVIPVTKQDNYIAAFQPVLENGKRVSLSVLENEMPVIMKDENGNRYDIFGFVVFGPNQGERLDSVTQFIAYWFAWAAFYPETSLN